MPFSEAASKVALKERAVFARLADGDGVIVDTETAFYFGLNKTATFLWQELSRPDGVTISDLTAALVRRFAVNAADAERDAIEFVEQILQHGLAACVNAPPAAGHSSDEPGRTA